MKETHKVMRKLQYYKITILQIKILIDFTELTLRDHTGLKMNAFNQ